LRNHGGFSGRNNSVSSFIDQSFSSCSSLFPLSYGGAGAAEGIVRKVVLFPSWIYTKAKEGAARQGGQTESPFIPYPLSTVLRAFFFNTALIVLQGPFLTAKETGAHIPLIYTSYKAKPHCRVI
jgi:hypothetical protein